MPEFYDLLISGCDRVYLVNCEVSKRVMCGFAFVEAYTQNNEVTLFDGEDPVAIILLKQEFVGCDHPTYISSPNDNLEFQLKP